MPRFLLFEVVSPRNAIIALTVATLPHATCFRTVRDTRQSGANEFIPTAVREGALL